MSVPVRVLKLLIAGNDSVGKSSILLRFTEDTFNCNQKLTPAAIGVDFRIRTVELDSKKIKLQIWDTTSQERFKDITSSYYREAMGIMLVYDVRNINSFESIQTWIRYISRCAPADVEWMILGNMTDLENARKITKKQGETLAAEHSVKFMETSAKTGQGINEAFLVLAQDINDKLDKKPHRETALHFATKNKSHCAVEVLVKNKAFLNSVDADGRTALMFAAENDDFLSLHFLLQAKADTTRRDKCGRTALHCAIEANSLSTADILIANMETAELNSVDNDGRTALMIAIEKADLTSLQMLLKADADIMLKRASDRTVLHYAAELGFHEAVKLLLEWEADINAVDKDGNTPLHIAALNNMPSVVDVLLKSKADADCVNKRGKRPYQLATEVQINSILWEARFAVLYAAGTVTPKAMKLCIIGDAGAGKTTLVEALRRGWFKSIFTWESHPDNPMCEYERTVGINVRTFDIPAVGCFSIFDFAGQKQFHKAHGLFFSAVNTFFILLISLRVAGKKRQLRYFEELIREASYWLAFLRASLRKEFVPTVMIAGSRADGCPTDVDSQDLLLEVISHLRGEFDKKINIREETLLLDCRKSWSPQMKQLRGLLKEVRDQYLKSDVRYPRLCEPVINSLLPALRQKQETLFMKTEQLAVVIEKEGDCPAQHNQREVINKVVDFLDESGEIIRVRGMVSLSPCWLSEYAVGPLMAPTHMKCHVQAPDGRMTKDQAERAIKQYLRHKKVKLQFSIDHILDMMVNMGLTFKLEDGTYMFPAHLPLRTLSELWKKEADKQMYVGRRYVCTSSTSIFSPLVFTQFQCQACVKLNIKYHLWRDGMIVAQAKKGHHVQCLVAMVNPLRAIDFVARGKDGSELECLSLLEDIMRAWTDVIEIHSSGTEYEIAYISRKHLTEHRDQPAVYSKEEVENAKREGPSALVTHDIELSESLADLLVFRPTKQHSESRPAIVQAVLKFGISQWYALGLELGFTGAEIDDYCYNKPDNSNKLLVLLEKKSNMVSMEVLEDLVLNACERLPHPIYAVVKEEFDKQVAGDAEQIYTEA